MPKKSAKSKKQQIPGSTEQNYQEKNKQQTKKEQEFSLYKLMNLQDGAKSTLEQIKKQYKKLVIQFHPDKNQGDPTARQKFQKLKEAYDVLVDPQKKKIYDQTGSIGDQFNEQAFQSAYEYYRQVYKKIQKQDIQAFEQKYRHGQMEQQDLINYYNEHKGDMTLLLEWIPLSRNEDIPRFVDFFQKKIESKEIKKYSIFEKTKNKIKSLPDESEEFQQMKKQQQQQKLSSLVLAIRNKSNGTSFLDVLQKKYCQPPKKKKIEKLPEDKAKRGKKIGK